MTKENALEFFKESNRETVTLFETVLNTPIPPKAKQSVEAREIAIEAIERQILKPVKYKNCHGDGADTYHKDFFACPTCGRRLQNKKQDPYCPRCGQALMWEVK